MHVQAWLATAFSFCVAAGVGVACGSDATSGGAGGAAGADASSGTGGHEDGGAAGAGSGSTPGSGGVANGTGGRPSPGSGGASGGSSSCPPECLVNNTCVTSCGQTPKDYGCCPCPPGTVNARTCTNIDAGSSTSVSCDQRLVLCRVAPPTCPQMQVPSIDGSCYGPCVPIDTCVCQAAEDCPDANEYTCHRSQGRCGPYVN